MGVIFGRRFTAMERNPDLARRWHLGGASEDGALGPTLTPAPADIQTSTVAG